MKKRHSVCDVRSGTPLESFVLTIKKSHLWSEFAVWWWWCQHQCWKEVRKHSWDPRTRGESMQTMWPLNATTEKTAHLLEISYGRKNMCPLAPSGHIRPLSLTGVGFQGLVDRCFKDLFCHQLAGQQTYSCWSHQALQSKHASDPGGMLQTQERAAWGFCWCI